MSARRRAWLPSVLFASLLLLPLVAEARPGGGQSYSGGSWSSSGGSSSFGGGSSSSSSGSGTTVQLSDAQGRVVFTLMLLVLGYAGCTAAWNAYNDQRDRQEWESRALRQAEDERREALRDDRDDLRRRDPEFSDSLFDDFARALFARVHEARHDAAILARLAPYVSIPARKQLRQREPIGAPVQTVVIGTIEPLRWRFDGGPFRFLIDVEFEANLVLADRTQYVRETWIFQRSARAQTRPWTGTRTFGCPSCGAPLEKVIDERCDACGQDVAPARFDWVVERIQPMVSEDRPSSLTGTVPERGTDSPTVVDAALEQNRSGLLADDPAALTGLEARVALVFAELNAAWARQDLRGARAYLSSGLHATLAQQVETYRAQGLVNEVAGARIIRTELVKIARDPRQDALTLRVFGTGCDYTYQKATGQIVGGSRDEERRYSEYWTLIRSASARGAARTDPVCPSCGAPLAVGMEGNCDHCGVLVASGDFDWVLGRIEQDDSYRG